VYFRISLPEALRPSVSLKIASIKALAVVWSEIRVSLRTDGPPEPSATRAAAKESAAERAKRIQQDLAKARKLKFKAKNEQEKEAELNAFLNASTAASDAEAIVVDDPDTLFQVVAVANSGSNVSTTVAAFGQVMVGSNCFPVTGNTANTLSGNSAIGVCLDASNARITTTTPFRIVALNDETAITTTGVISSAASSATQVLTAANSNIRVGMQVTGSGVAANTYVTSVSDATIIVSTSFQSVLGSTLTFVGAPEVIVKFNFGYHSYYNAAGV